MRFLVFVVKALFTVLVRFPIELTIAVLTAIAKRIDRAIVIAAIVYSSQAMADSPQFGGCFANGNVCAGPSAAITVASFNLATSQFSGGITPGVGYGVTYAPFRWYSVGVDLYASLRLGQGQPNQATFSLMGHFADYVFVGVGPSITQRDGPALVQWSVLFGLGVPIGARSTGGK